MADQQSLSVAPSAGAAAPTGSEPPTSKKEKKEKFKPVNLVVPPKKPKLSKAERRELQERQRATKAGSGETGGSKGGSSGGRDAGSKTGGGGNGLSEGAAATGKRPHAGKENGGEDEENSDGGEGSKSSGSDDKTVALFSHLPRPRAPEELEREFSGVNLGTAELHPAVVKLGHSFATGTLRGGNARCRAMLSTYKTLLRSYAPPPNVRDVRHDIDHRVLKPAFQYWTARCRPHSVSMGNAFTFLKSAVANHIDRDTEWNDEVRELVEESVDAYVTERIDYAGKAISRHAGSKIQSEGDVVLVFGRSEVIDRVLVDAATKDGKDFRVVVVDSRPLLEGRETLHTLSEAGIPCTYVLLNALSYLMMREVTKVFLGASALMSNGSVLSRAGAACVALMARANHVPVLVCCETYKISHRVQLESITGNELGNPEDVARTDCAMSSNDDDGFFNGDGGNNGTKKEILANWRKQPNLKLLNLMYDVTPSDFVSGIVTELGILPPTSVAVLLREMSPQDNNDSAFKGTEY